MTYQPPRWLERTGERLLPPASAEHALGDLAECSTSHAAYLANLASILPRIVWCQIRRRATIGGVIFNAMLSGFALVAAQRIAGGSFLDGPWELPRLAGPWAIWVVGCALAAAYGPPGQPFAWSTRGFVAVTTASLGAAAVLEVPILRVAAGLGASFAASFALSMPFSMSGMPPPLSAETLSEHARLFQKGIWWRNAREQAVAAVLIVFKARTLGTATGADFWGQLLLIAGMLFIIAYLFVKAHPRRVPDTADFPVLQQFHRGELARQRDVLRAVPLWYLLPFVPGFAAMTMANWSTQGAGTLGALPVLAIVFGVIWALNKAAANFLDGQLQALDALPRPGGDR
jgi:hypothetical protein